MAAPRYEWVEFPREGVATPAEVFNTNKFADEPMPLEVKYCETISAPPKKFPTQARISCGGKVPTGRIANRYNLITDSPCRIDRLEAMKHKGQEEATDEPKDYEQDGGWDSYCTPTWGSTEKNNDGWGDWGEQQEEKQELDRREDKGKGNMPEDDGPTEFNAHTYHCCLVCRHRILELICDLEETHHTIDALMRRMSSIEDSNYEDYKFLNQSVRKLFRMYGTLKRKMNASPSK